MAAKPQAVGKANLCQQAIVTYSCIFLWIFLSAAVILINKYVLGYSGFPYPVTLTLTHMAFCSLLSTALIWFGVTETAHLDRSMYLRNIVPIAALFSGTLWLGNAAYLYLSVSFIQMLKASMPVTVFSVGVFLGTEKFSTSYAANMVVVAIGVCVASYGEINFNLIGVLVQSGSIVTESFRLALIQILLQQRGIKLNPITTLYYIAPACFVFLTIPFAFLELPRMLQDKALILSPGLLLLSAVGAFALNMSVFLLIGKSSALTMNVAGVIKDWMLIGLSVLIYKTPVAALQLGGYGVAFLGVCWYNYQKVKGMQAAVSEKSVEMNSEKQPLVADNDDVEKRDSRE